VHPILVHIFLQNDHYYGLLMDCKKNSILFWKGSKRGPNSKILHIWKAYLTFEIVNQNKFPKYNGPPYYCVQHIIVSSKIVCPPYYCVHHITVSTILLCPPYYCVHHITVSTILLCPPYYCVQHITVSTILLCPTYYCVKQNSVSTLTFNIHLFNFLLSRSCFHIILQSA
jgi:hypothetical protein